MAYLQKDNREDIITARIMDEIRTGRFNWLRHTTRHEYRGVEIMTQPLHASYGQIGYEVYVYDSRGRHAHTVSYDWEMRRLTLDDYTEKEIDELEKRDEFYAKMSALMEEYDAVFTIRKGDGGYDVFCSLGDGDEKLVAAGTETLEAGHLVSDD